MDKIYKVRVVGIDPATGAEEEVLADDYAGFLLLADCGDGRMAEVIIHENIMGMATKLAQGKKTRDAVRLANVLMQMKSDAADSIESALLHAIAGGDNDE